MKIEEVAKLSPMDRLVYWIKERESIRLKKESGASKLWTDDKILQSYRFCNIRRMDDKVSVWLMDNWYRPNFDHHNMLFAVGLARFINKPESLEIITDLVFNRNAPKWKTIIKVLRKYRDSGNTVFNGAYMVRGNNGVDKLDSVINYYVRPLINVETYPDSMEETHESICKSYGMGSFMAGQVVADLRWAVTGTWKDRNMWAPIGPGSKRGMNRLKERKLNHPLNQNQFLGELIALRESLHKHIPNSIFKRLELHDVQNCLCEFDKYERALSGEGKPKQKYSGGNHA